MIRISFYILSILLLSLKSYAISIETNNLTNNSDSDRDIALIIQELNQEITHIQNRYDIKRSNITLELKNTVLELGTAQILKRQVALLIKKEQLKEQLAELNASEATDISKIRYLKGLSIIKILYDKVLALDHHFASIATFNEINKISNPNHYPEFDGVKDLIKKGSSKKQGLDLTPLLGNNIYANMANTLVGLVISPAPKASKQVELKKVECIMDFTLRMHQDLNTIYFETSFLQKSNDKIKADLERLFIDFTKPIKYNTPLATCRNTDDWDSVHDNLQIYLDKITTLIEAGDKPNKVHTMRVNLEFPIDRLLQFITQYNNFIDQGGKFYEKFKIILDSYENKQQCQSSLPIEYTKLKNDIDVAIEKFNTAYKPVEINGSKMKEILYGLNEYD